jgi:signal transduction histidine kinase
MTRGVRVLSLEQKLALLMTGTIVVVLSMSLALTYRALTRSAETELSEQLAGAARQLGASVSAGRARTAAGLSALARGEPVVRALTADGAALPGAVAAVRPVLEEFRPSTNDSTAPVELWTVSGRRIATAGQAVPLETLVPLEPDGARTGGVSVLAVPRPGIPSLPERDSIVTGELYADSGGVYWWMVAPVEHRDTVVGYVAHRFQLSLTSEAARGLRQLTGENVSLIVYNRSGSLWVAPPGVPTAPRVAGDSIGAGRFYDSPGGPVIGAELPPTGLLWTALLETPLVSAHARARALLVTIASLGLVLTIIGAALSIVIGRRVARPLAALTKAAEAIAGGDYSRRVPFTGSHEIGRLGVSFNQMATEVDVARHELERRFEETRASAERLEQSNEQLQAAMMEAERLREEAQHANRAKSDFLAVMSHELRTPLNAIGGYTQLIDLGVHGPVTDTQHDALARIARSQEHLLRLINDVLNFARVDAGQVRYALRDVPLNATLASLEALIAPQMRAKQLSFQYDQCDPSLTVYADADKLQQIVLNLLTNAIKFTPEGGRIQVGCERADDVVRIHVRDSGVGIPAERLKVIFDPFVQLDRTVSSTREGVGLGLAISRDLARGMSGELEVESEQGEGSTFTVILPSDAMSRARRRAASDAVAVLVGRDG